MAYRAREHDFCDVSTSPWNNHWELRVTDRIKAVLTPELFLSVKHFMKPGDKVNITSFVGGSQERVQDIAEIRIIQVHDEGVEFKLMGEVMEIPAEHLAVAEKDGTSLHVKRGFHEFLVQDGEGNTLESFKTKQAAEEYVQGAM